ncbi:SRPBCC family protein [Actinopolymorpha sp. B9G3]|uniref:SRPBCC family protein n=1 Tax=Actinopolymorpha sp. B9G3 TaxID=3158970 RepID=UPI0032D8F018
MGTQGDRDQAAEVRVTGARTHIDLTIALPQSRVWDLIADVTRIGEWSPECVHGAWLDDGAGQAHAQVQAQVPAPAQAYARVGARFAGDNRFANGNVSTVTCVVTQAERPHRFAWVVLDGAEDPDRPGSIWSYELTPGGSADETRVRHTFVHGPGDTGVRAAVRQHPEQAAEIVDGRLAQLRRHMIETLRGMERA